MKQSDTMAHGNTIAYTVSVCGAETDVAASAEQHSCIQFYIAPVSGRAVVILILPGL